MNRQTRDIVILALLAGCTAYADDNSPSLWSRAYLFDNLGGLRSTLKNNGIDFAPTYLGEVMGNVSGGRYGTGTVYDHSLNLPLTVDFEKMGTGWKGATIHANAFWLSGRSLTDDYVGDLANISNISANPTVRLQELWLQQTFWNDCVSVKAGIMNVDSEFFSSAAAGLFINSSFGTFSLIAANLPDPPIYPVAAPGIRFWMQPDAHFYFQAGVYDGDSGSQNANKNGTDFHVSNGDGTLIFSEAGYYSHPDAGEHTLAGVFKIGSFVHTRNFPTWQTQISGGTAAGSGDFGIYGVAEQDLLKASGGKVTGFIRGGGAPADRNVISWYLDAGFNFTGFIPGRDDDVVGIAFARSTFSREFSGYQQTVNGTRSFDSEMVIEATYRVQITPWWALQPDFQMIFTPGGESSSADAVVLGLRTTITF